MKVLNLTNNETSDIKFEVSKFPDGQQQVKIDKNSMMDHYHTVKSSIDPHVIIKVRLNDFKDLELICCTVASLKQILIDQKIKSWSLYVPYFLGSRSDRKFEEGSNNYLKDVICPIINSLNFESVTVLDPHSSTLEACLTNFKEISNQTLVKFAIMEDINKKFILISPDAGANKKIFKVAEQIGYNGEIITCSKSRDEQGKITHVVVPIKYEETKDIVIIDDICDGGATFNNIAAALNDAGHQGKKYLIITHGIFSKGFDELFKYFDGIYCTNSYSEIDSESRNINLKQLNVF